MMDIEGRGQTLRVYFGFNRALIDALKQKIPSAGRKWVPEDKCWEVSAQYLDTLKDLSQRYIGRQPYIRGEIETPESRRHTIILDYMGFIRHRGGSTYTATGWMDGGWNVTFPAEVLQNYFGFASKPGSALTLYDTLSVSQQASGAELKKAWRRAARTWHPDVCKEDGAAEQFMLVQRAYEILSDPPMRQKYDAALFFQDDAEYQVENKILEWKPPMRCGILTVEGVKTMGKIVVEKIVDWRDIERYDGKTRVTYWPKGGDTFAEKWV